MYNSITNRNNSLTQIKKDLPRKRKQIFELICKHNGITAQEICKHYQIPINQVSGRIKELKDMCYIKEVGSITNYFTKTKNTRYESVKDEEEFMRLSKETFVKLRDKKDNLTRDYQQFLSEDTRDFVRKEILKIENQIERLGSIEIAVTH